MRHWFYDLSSGILSGDSYAGSDLACNTPPGLGAITGVADWRAQRVDVSTGELVPYQPPAPLETDLQTWAWDAQAWAWVAMPTTAALEAGIRAERDRLLTACDWVRLRSLDLGQPIPPDWLAYRQALRDLPQQTGFPTNVTWPAKPSGAN